MAENVSDAGVQVEPLQTFPDSMETASPPTRFPYMSMSVSVSVDVPPAETLVGLAVNVDLLADGAPATNVTVAPTDAAPITAMSVFVSAFVEAIVALKKLAKCDDADAIFHALDALDKMTLPLAEKAISESLRDA